MQDTLTDKSDATWAAAEMNFKAGDYSSAASRYYYAVFQAIKAYWIATSYCEMKDRQKLVNARDPKSGRVENKMRGMHGLAQMAVNSGFYGDQLLSFASLRELRIRVDYYPEPVSRDEIEDVRDHASLIRDHFKGRAAKPLTQSQKKASKP
jgi:HEPN domain